MTNSQRLLDLLVKLQGWRNEMVKAIRDNWRGALPREVSSPGEQPGKGAGAAKLREWKDKKDRHDAYEKKYAQCLVDACKKKEGHDTDRDKALFVLCSANQAISDLANLIGGRNVMGKLTKAGKGLDEAKKQIDEIREFLEKYEEARSTGVEMKPRELRAFFRKMGPALGKLDQTHALGSMLKPLTHKDYARRIRGLTVEKLKKTAKALDRLHTVVDGIKTAYDYFQNPDQLATTMVASKGALKAIQYVPQAAYLKGYYGELAKQLEEVGFKGLSEIQIKQGNQAMAYWKNGMSQYDVYIMSYPWAKEFWKNRTRGVIKSILNKKVSWGDRGGGSKKLPVKLPRM